MNASYGPVITSLIHVADAEDGGEGRGFYIVTPNSILRKEYYS